MTIHSHWYYNLSIYLIVLLLLALGVFLKTNMTIFLAVFIFIVWDIGYFISTSNQHARTVELSLQGTQYIREHLSYYLAFYGVLFGILFTQSTQKQEFFFSLLESSGVPIFLLVIPFIIASVTLFFVPIALTNDKNEPSSSLRLLVVITAFFQKISIYIFVHTLITYILFDKNLDNNE